MTTEELHKKLIEKDKEIERLKQCVMSREQVEAILKPEISYLTKQLTKEITPIIMKECRHQICEEIRHNFYVCKDSYCNEEGIKIITYHINNFILDQIEKGEEV